MHLFDVPSLLKGWRYNSLSQEGHVHAYPRNDFGMGECIPLARGVAQTNGYEGGKIPWVLSSGEKQTKVRTHFMCGFGYGFSGWMWVAMPLIMLLGIALVAVFIWGLVRWLNRRAALPQPRDARPIEYDRPPLEILQERYARV